MSYSIEKQRKVKQQIEDWKKEKPIILAEQELKQDIKNTKGKIKKTKKPLTTTKFLMFFLFISCSIIELFTMYAIIKGMNMGFGIDFSPLTMLISAVVAETIGFSIYSLKSMKENTQGGIVYQTALLEKEKCNQENIFEDEQEVVG